MKSFNQLLKNLVMSDIYLTEPPTEGKVVIKTNQGEIDIELWPKEAELACRNFIQLCLEGYYDNSPIHRILKDFMVSVLVLCLSVFIFLYSDILIH